MIISLIKNKYIIVLALLGSCLLSCKQKAAERNNLYLCTSSGDLYGFDLKTNKLKWSIAGSTDNDMISYFTINGDHLIKAYIDGRILSVNKATGKVEWTYRDAVSPDQAYYHYDFSDVRFCFFAQYPVIYQNAMIFANTHGELKSVDIKTRKVNWIYQVSIPLNFAPVLFHNTLLLNMGYRIITVDPHNGKLLQGVDFATPVPVQTATDGTYDYAVDEQGSAYCINSDLVTVWKYENKDDESAKQNVVVGENEIIYGHNSMKCLDKADGRLLWRTKLSGEDDILHYNFNDNIVYANTAHDIYLLDKKDGHVLKHKHINGRNIVGMVSYNNGYYYTGSDKTLCKVDDDLAKEIIVAKQLKFSDDADDTYMVFN